MSWQIITEKKRWNEFVLSHAPVSGAFLQSWEWGEFQRSLGREVKRVGIVVSGECTCAVQWIAYPLPFGKRFWYAPRVVGSCFHSNVSHVKSVLGEAAFLRVEPANDVLRPSGWKEGISVQPKHTRLINLNLSQDDLLEQMHQKTRYNIRLAQRRGVFVNIEAATLNDVWELFSQTSVRGAFHLHPKIYYQKMLAHCSDDFSVMLATAQFDNEILAANIMIDFGNTRTYLHGASSNSGRSSMAPYALHWQLMQHAKQQGLHWYDWWGVSPADNPHHPWNGISRFKRGFGGKDISFSGAFEHPSSPFWYTTYRFAKIVRACFHKRVLLHAEAP